MTEPVGVLAVGAATGALRLDAAEVTRAWGGSGGRGRAAVAAPDEDTLTLAWDAATAALAAAGVDGDGIGGLWWGTTRPPFAEGPSFAYLASALGLRPGAEGSLASGSPHAGIEALVGAWDAVRAGAVSTAVVVASDAVVPGTGTAFEVRAGAGAVAVVLSAVGGAATLGRRLTRSQPALDRYRGDGEPATRDPYDPRLLREEVFVPAVTGVASALEAPDGCRWSLPDPDGRLGRVVARGVGVDEPASATAYAAAGDTGAAAPLLGAVPALTEAGPVAVLAFAAGRTTGVTLDVVTPVPGAQQAVAALGQGREAPYPEVLRARGQLSPTGESVEMGVPPGSAMFVRGNPEMLGLLGGRCADCGTISTPPSVRPHCVACGGPKLEPVALTRHGTVHTYVVNHTMPAPFEAPLGLAVLDLDDGARLMVQATDPEGLEIGAEVDLVLRRYAFERGVPVYGFKARPKAIGNRA